MQKTISHLLLIAFVQFGTWHLPAQNLESATYLSNTPVTLLAGFSSDAKYNVDAYKIRYYTTDIDGSTTVVSGALLVPVNTPCDSFALGVYNHGTVLDREDVPSRDNFEALVGKVMASTGAVAVAPDYLGLGDNPGLHPYLHGESEATATLDLIRAAREYLRDSLGVDLNGEVFVTGYSQGGHAAMATVKYVEDNNLFPEFNIIGAGPASGPYNLSSTMLPLLLSNTPYSNPGYIVYLLFAMERVYGNIYQDYEDILDSPYDSLIPPLFDGTNTMAVVNNALPNKIRDFLQDTVIDNLIADSVTQSHPIRLALEDNDNYDWAPSFPMELYYCTQDEQVDYQNSLDAEAAMQARGANVTAVFRGNFNHGGCFLPSLGSALDFFQNLSTGCQSVSLAEMTESNIEVYPIPARDWVQVQGLAGRPIVVCDLHGNKVFEGPVPQNELIDLSHCAPGVYLLKPVEQVFSEAIKLVKAP